MRRRIVCALLALALCIPLSLSASAEGQFQDVPAGFWAAEAISRCAGLGFFKGETADRFGVGKPMTRGNFTVVLCRFMGWDASAPREIFEDVPAAAFCAGAVTAAYDHGAVTRSSSRFRPYEAITREEMAVMLVRALGYADIAGLAAADPDSFKDVTSSRGYVTMAHELGIVNGVSAASFAPARAASREQTAVMLMRTYDRLRATEVKELLIADYSGRIEVPEGTETVAVTAYSLTGGAQPRLSFEMGTAGWKNAAERAGAKILLRVTGGEDALAAPAGELAALLAEQVRESGCDGLYLDVPGDGAALKALAPELRSALSGGLLYLCADAPVRPGAAADFAALAAAADKIVLRVAPKDEKVGDFPVGAVDPLEDVYYALAAVTDTVAPEKIALRLTTSGRRYVNGRADTDASPDTVRSLEGRGGTETYHSDRYACAYLQSGSTVIWYLNEADIALRRQTAACFGVDVLCRDAAR